MAFLILKALLSGLIIALASEAARRWPGIGGLIVSLPLVSLLTFLRGWRDTGDGEKIAQLSQSAFWFFLPSMPLFLVLPAMLRSGINFWTSFAVSVIGTAALYALMFFIAPRAGIRL